MIIRAVADIAAVNRRDPRKAHHQVFCFAVSGSLLMAVNIRVSTKRVVKYNKQNLATDLHVQQEQKPVDAGVCLTETGSIYFNFNLNWRKWWISHSLLVGRVVGYQPVVDGWIQVKRKLFVHASPPCTLI